MELLRNPYDIHIEVRLKSGNVRPESIQSQLQTELTEYFEKRRELLASENIQITDELGPCVNDNVAAITIDDHIPSQSTADNVLIDPHSRFVFHIYRPQTRNVEVETFNAEPDGSEEEVPASNHWLLPSQSFVGLWENLIYEEGLKAKLLKYAESSLLFSRHNVDHNIISCNRIILLHGPPGTGKTSLCKAIAQKLSIRVMSKYKYTHLIEINSHSLFSKWFSESGKLVMKLFTNVREIIAQPSSLVCVLIDEVESIAYARESMSGQEPKDAMRVVNALLTQLDSIKEFPNVLILATSNLASNIDLAFLDRADIKQHIDLPSERAVYQIYLSMLRELMRVEILKTEDLKLFDSLGSTALLALAKKSVGMSGRTLRKIPFLAHAMFVNSTNPLDVKNFLKAMESALDKHISDQFLLKSSK